jgi:hypothetical protein
MLMKTQPLSRCGRDLGTSYSQNKSWEFNRLRFARRSLQKYNSYILFAGMSQNVYENKERDSGEILRSQNANDNKEVVKCKPECIKKERGCWSAPRKNGSFSRRRERFAVAAVYDRRDRMELQAGGQRPPLQQGNGFGQSTLLPTANDFILNWPSATALLVISFPRDCGGEFSRSVPSPALLELVERGECPAGERWI